MNLPPFIYIAFYCNKEPSYHLFTMSKMIQCGIIARNFSSSSAVQSAIKNVTVIGGGLMGSGIAQVMIEFLNNNIWCLKNNTYLTDFSTCLLAGMYLVEVGHPSEDRPRQNLTLLCKLATTPPFSGVSTSRPECNPCGFKLWSARESPKVHRW